MVEQTYRPARNSRSARPSAQRNKEEWVKFNVRHLGSARLFANAFNNADARPDFSIYLSVSKKTLLVHKFILEMSSSVFLALLRSNMIESTSSAMNYSDEEDGDGDEQILVAIIKSLYSGNIKLHNVKQVLTALKIVDKYEFKSVESSIIDIISKRNLTTEDALMLIQLPKEVKYQPIHAKIKEILQEKGSNLLSGTAFVNLDHESFKFILEVVAYKNNLSAILDAIQSWVIAFKHERQVYTLELLEIVNKNKQ
jgi:hypothetical protein